MLNRYKVSCKATKGRWRTRKTAEGVIREIVPVSDLYTTYEFKVTAEDETKAKSACIREAIKKSNSTMFIVDIQAERIYV
jgi:hypothetical protein